MAETLESFVEKLRAEGVEAGREAAAALLREARAEAERIVSEARAEAGYIVSEARAGASRVAERQQHELDLAVRDSLLRLHEGVTRAVTALVRQRTAEVLATEGFLVELVRDVVLQYARQDAERRTPVTVRVPPEAAETLAQLAVRGVTDGASPATAVRLETHLEEQGFEYRVRGGTVEVTVDSVAEVLGRHVCARVRERLARALADPPPERDAPARRERGAKCGGTTTS